MKDNIFFLDADLIELALNNLVDQRNFLQKISWGERFLSPQVDVSAQGQKGSEEEREEITHPPPRSSSPVWLFTHLTP